MPKLSAYVDAGQTGDTPSVSAAVPQGPLASAAGPSLARRPPQQQQQPQKQPPPGSLEQPSLGLQHEAAANKLQAEYAKRLREHGPRTFRWPDGSLRPERPPPNPHAVANRQQWAELVQHCRTHGGDRGNERQGASLRYGIGVAHQQHEAYLARIGLEAETDAAGRYKGEVPGLPSPLEEPEHCFNTYYRKGAEAVFKDARGKLL